jgi:putative transposase
MIQRESPTVSVARQCDLLGVKRSSLYLTPSAKPDPRLPLMSVIDRIYMEYPFMGSRQMTRALRAAGFPVHRSRVQRLMQLMDIRSMAPGPHTSRKHPSHPISEIWTFEFGESNMIVVQSISLTRRWAVSLTSMPAPTSQSRGNRCTPSESRMSGGLHLPLPAAGSGSHPSERDVGYGDHLPTF